MNISDSDLLTCVRNMLRTEKKSAEELLGYSSTYFGDETLKRLSLSDIVMSFTILEGDKLAELLRDITSRCGRDVNFVHGRDLGGYIRWTCTGYVGGKGNEKPVVIYTPIILDKRSAHLLLNNRMAVEGTGTYFAPRYDMPQFEFRNGKIDKLIIVNNNPDIHNLVKFTTGLDKLYYSIVVEKMIDRKLVELRRSGNLLKHDLFLDYRIENLASDDITAQSERAKANAQAILYAARKQIDIVSGYADLQSRKPWLDISEDPTKDSLTEMYFKNVYARQSKFDVKVSTHIGQVPIGSVYSPFVGAMYADAYIHQHMSEIPDPLPKLNFPNHRVPLRCMCRNCETIVRKRGPQPKKDVLLFSKEYTEAQVNVKAIS